MGSFTVAHSLSGKSYIYSSNLCSYLGSNTLGTYSYYFRLTSNEISTATAKTSSVPCSLNAPTVTSDSSYFYIAFTTPSDFPQVSGVRFGEKAIQESMGAHSPRVMAV